MWIMPLHLHVNQKSDYDMICDLYSLKQRSASITFSNNQLLSKPAEYNVLLLRYSNLYTSAVNDNALPV